MQIHIYKPGGQKEGPYSLEQINSDLAAGRYSGSDYWAWHEGLPEWVPLYSLPGIRDVPREPAPATRGPAKSSDEQPPAKPDQSEAATEPEAAEAKPEAAGGEPEPLETDKLPSGMPFAALEHIFILTSGDGPSGSRSPTTAAMLEKITGEDLATISSQVPRDVVGNCDILQGLKGQSSMPGAVWRRMGAIRPELLQQARDGAHRICIRSFRVDEAELVSVFLFYNKQKL